MFNVSGFSNCYDKVIYCKFFFKFLNYNKPLKVKKQKLLLLLVKIQQDDIFNIKKFLIVIKRLYSIIIIQTKMQNKSFLKYKVNELMILIFLFYYKFTGIRNKNIFSNIFFFTFNFMPLKSYHL